MRILLLLNGRNEVEDLSRPKEKKIAPSVTDFRGGEPEAGRNEKGEGIEVRGEDLSVAY